MSRAGACRTLTSAASPYMIFGSFACREEGEAFDAAKVVEGVKVAVNPFVDTLIVPEIGCCPLPAGVTVNVEFVTVKGSICLLNCS